MTRKSGKHLRATYGTVGQNHWTAVLTLLGLISSVYRDLPNIIPLFKKEKCTSISLPLRL